jgi:methyl-accepting chemotaxis protein
MREGVIIEQFRLIQKEFGRIWDLLGKISQGFQIQVISQSVREQALHNLLIDKGIMSQAELDEAIKKEAIKVQQEADKLATSAKIVTPTTAEVRQVASPAAEAIVPPVVVPPAV